MASSIVMRIDALCRRNTEMQSCVPFKKTQHISTVLASIASKACGVELIGCGGRNLSIHRSHGCEKARQRLLGRQPHSKQAT